MQIARNASLYIRMYIFIYMCVVHTVVESQKTYIYIYVVNTCTYESHLHCVHTCVDLHGFTYITVEA